MKVVHLTIVHPWNDNRIYEKMVCSLRTTDIKTYYIAPLPDNDLSKINKNITIFWLKNRKGLLGRIQKNIEALLIIKKIGKCIVHFHDPEFILGAVLLRLFGFDIVYDIHEDNKLGIQQKDYLPKIVRKPLALLVASVEKVTGYLFNQVIAERCYKKRFPNAVSVLNYPKITEKLPELQKYNTDKIRLIYTGTLTKDRGAFRHVDIIKIIPHAELHFFGRCDNKLLNEIKEYAGEENNRIIYRVKPEGFSYQELDRYYLSGNWTAGLAVFPKTPHYYEKELTKFFEYMLYGIPIVCSNFPIWENIVCQNKVGRVVNPEKLDDIVSIITEIHANQFFRDTIIINARNAVTTKYNWDSEFIKLLNLYKKIEQKTMADR
jgi:glycosyltransferase involved in cell wall biosynthesis